MSDTETRHTETLVSLGSKTPTTAITVTDPAVAKVASLLEAEADTDLALRVAVRPGGCSGYSYEMFFDADRADDDEVVTAGDVTVLVDPASAQLLRGSVLDYKDGLTDAGFSINNPNAQRSCGCGQSFS
jgi:iron-sulfur cluster assembly protein/iron-sulfur cluster insertion protein